MKTRMITTGNCTVFTDSCVSLAITSLTYRIYRRYIHVLYRPTSANNPHDFLSPTLCAVRFLCAASVIYSWPQRDSVTQRDTVWRYQFLTIYRFDFSANTGMTDSFDNDSFDEPDPDTLPVLGSASALYPFDGKCTAPPPPRCLCVKICAIFFVLGWKACTENTVRQNIFARKNFCECS